MVFMRSFFFYFLPTFILSARFLEKLLTNLLEKLIFLAQISQTKVGRNTKVGEKWAAKNPVI